MVPAHEEPPLTSVEMQMDEFPEGFVEKHCSSNEAIKTFWWLGNIRIKHFKIYAPAAAPYKVLSDEKYRVEQS